MNKGIKICNLLFCLLSGIITLKLSAQTNVVYMMADDLGWGDISYHGSDIPTPHLDAFFAESTELTNFMSWSVCSPTRAGFLTGVHPVLTDQAPIVDGELKGEMITIAEAFKTQGYATGAFGKWHNNEAQFFDKQGNVIPTPSGFPRGTGNFIVNDHGFDEWAGHYSGGAGYTDKMGLGIPNWFHNHLYVPHVWDTDPEYIDDRDEYLTFLEADYAINFIETSVQQGKPFFCYIPWSSPHSPIEFKDANNPDPRIPAGRTGEDAMYAEMIIYLDDAVGQVLAKLDQLGLKNDTIVVFTSDNGGVDSRARNEPFNKGKHWDYDGGIHVATAMRWPAGGLTGSNGSDVYPGLMGYLDMYPTIMDMCGYAPLPDENYTLDGKNVWPALQSRTTPSPVDYYYSSSRGMDMVRTQTHKYLRHAQEEYLFDLVNDVGETTNVKNSNTALFNQLKQAAADFYNENDIYYSHVQMDASEVDLPAPSGDILKITLTKNTANLSGDFWLEFSTNTQTGKKGSYFEYDVFIPNSSAALNAYVTIAKTTGTDSNLGGNDRFDNYSALDSEGNSYDNWTGNSYSKAHGQWHRYRVGLDSFSPVATGKPHILLDKNSPTGTYEIYLDNVNFQGPGLHDTVGWANASHLKLKEKVDANVTVSAEVVSLSSLNINAARFMSVNLPDEMAPGMAFDAELTFGNIGSSNWSNATDYKIGSQNVQDNTTWGVNRVLIDMIASIAPGETYTFTVPAVAPVSTGNYNFQWRMLQEGSGWFGDQSNNQSISISNNVDAAQFVSIAGPNLVAPGSAFDVVVTAKNIGTTTWTNAANYRIGTQNPQDNTTWGLNRASINGAASVAPGQTYAFTVSCTAPVIPGNYDMQWRMIQSGGAGWFGQTSMNKNIKVITDDAEFVSISVPDEMAAGVNFDAQISFRNTGTTTWTQASGIELASQGPANNTTWGTNRLTVPAGVSVAPGATYTFSQTLTSPATTGSFKFQWQLLENGTVFFGDQSPEIFIDVSASIAANQFVSMSVPSFIAPGASFIGDVTYRNIGTTTWTAAANYKTGAQAPQDNSTWGRNQVTMDGSATVLPGQTHTFSINFTAPSVEGTYYFQRKMLQSNGAGWFGEQTPLVPIEVTNSANNDAAFVSQNIPTTIEAGQSFNAEVTYSNTGNTTWSMPAGYKLGSQNPADNTIWNLQSRLDLPANVAPGESYTFVIPCIAPGIEGSYNFQRQMIHDGGTGWFGDLSSNVSITVTAPPPDNALFVSQNLPTTVEPGENFNVQVTFENTGTTTWSAGSGYKLGSQNPTGNTVWGTPSSISVSSDVAPGASHTFNITCVAPQAEGIYDFQRQMMQEGGAGWFGTLSPNQTIAVVPQKPAGLVDRTNEPGAIISSQHNDSPAGNEDAKLFDNDLNTEYYTDNGSSWVQHRFGGANKFTAVWYSVTSAINTPPPAPSPNLLLNSSFETGGAAPTDWILSSTGLAEGSTEQMQDGNPSLKMSTPTPLQVTPTRQVINNILPNTDYEVSVWVLNAGQTAGNAVLDLSDKPAPGEEVQFVMGPGAAPIWTKYTGTFNSASETSITVRMFTNSSFIGTVYFDNLTFTEVPSAVDAVPMDPASWTLSGSNDGSNWSTVDTRSGVSFSGRGQTLEFSALGNTTAYEYYRFEAVSGGGAALQFAELELWGDANEGSEPIEQWKQTHGITDLLADADGDGILNLVEYALNGDPNLQDSGALRPGAVENGSNFDFTFRRERSDVTYVVETSTDLALWSEFDTDPGNVGEDVTVSVPDSLMASGKLFIRLRVEN